MNKQRDRRGRPSQGNADQAALAMPTRFIIASWKSPTICASGPVFTVFSVMPD
jgi:hypothetical protein